MSAVAPLLKPFGLGGPDKSGGRPPSKSRPRLVIVAAPSRRAGRVPFAILIGAILVAGLVTLLMLHTMAAQDGFKVSALQQQQKTLNDQLQSLEQAVQADSAPNTLRQEAAALGMLPSVVNSYRHLADGRVVGVETPVYPVAPVVTTPDSTSKQAGTDKSTTDKSSSGKTGSDQAGTDHHATTASTSTGTTSTTKTSGDTAKAGGTTTTGGTATTTNPPAHHGGHPHR